jgi:hypothetical protein
MATARHLLAPLLVVAGLSGCGEVTPPKPVHPILIVVNKCDSKKENGEYVFPLKELRLHQSLSNYGAASNLLVSGQLDPGAEVMLTNISPGSYYVTVFRPMGPWQPQLVAVTGATPIDLNQSQTYRLLIYEEAFYLYPPAPLPDGIRERGPDGRRDAGTRDLVAPDRGQGDRGAGDTGQPEAKPVDARPIEAGLADRLLQ